MRALGPLFVLLCALSACASSTTRSRAIVAIDPAPATPGWRDTADPADAAALDSLPALWSEALTAPAKRGQRAAAMGDAALLDPKAALDHPALPPGSYTCRVVRVERGRTRGFPPQFCFVGGEADGRLSFNKQTGSDLPNGWLYADENDRYVFLGAQQRKPGDNSIAYGTDRSRDVAGVVERVGSFRWRLVVPRSKPKALWIYELTPVPAERQPG
ncbi:DUF4893 domain-containing protein [Sphingomonas sp. DT-204]|uniref:DUF4893 domain-containing protein n=1 Tax=Sphingomonas sp. DT-204 TaxID=3396166 RepID=UPI003F1E2530